MILLRIIVSLKNIYLNESQWLYTLQKYMEISLNLMDFTDFFYIEISINLISFSSRYTFSLNLLPKASVVWAKNCVFTFFFFVANRIGSETSHKLLN